jgi:hypothetical protein
VAERVMRRSVLDSILASAEWTTTDRQHLSEIVLMAALADSFITDEDLQRVIQTITTYGELEGVSESWLIDRANELKETAPLFSEARANLVRDLTDPRLRRLGLSLATKLVGSVRPSVEEEKALLYTLADAFRIAESERPRLLSSWMSDTTFTPDNTTYTRCAFNAPGKLTKYSLFDAMLHAESEQEFRLLTHKVSATRFLIGKLFETAEILGLGEIVRVGPYGFRIDALIEHETLGDTGVDVTGSLRITLSDSLTPGFERYLTRYLAPGEALHPLEHGIIDALVHRLDESSHVLIVHSEDLSHGDRVFLQGMDPQKVRGERLEA